LPVSSGRSWSSRRAATRSSCNDLPQFAELP
jgi:hypothetical protein